MPAGSVKLVAKSRSYSVTKQPKRPMRVRSMGKRRRRAPKYIQVESKRLTTEFTKNLYHIGGTTNFRDNNIFPLTPNTALGNIYQIVQGTGQQQRVGNSVSPRKVIFRGVLTPNPYNATSNPTPNPVMVRMYILSTKRNIPSGSAAEVYNVMNNTFFANGNTSLGLLGTLYDLVTPPNNDVVTIHYTKTFKLGYENYSGVTGGADVSQTKASNDYRLNHFIKMNITKAFSKKWQFNDNDGGTTSRQVYCVFQPVNFNGSIPVASTTPCAFIGGIDVHYDDA